MDSPRKKYHNLFLLDNYTCAMSVQHKDIRAYKASVI
jgi:hypothetical protein